MQMKSSINIYRLYYIPPNSLYIIAEISVSWLLFYCIITQWKSRHFFSLRNNWLLIFALLVLSDVFFAQQSSSNEMNSFLQLLGAQEELFCAVYAIVFVIN